MWQQIAGGDAPSFRATVEGKPVQVRIGADGQIWTWTERGQLTLANSEQAQAWVLEHVHAHDLRTPYLAVLPPRAMREETKDTIHLWRGGAR